jgi:hypothetical protein
MLTFSFPATLLVAPKASLFLPAVIFCFFPMWLSPPACVERLAGWLEENVRQYTGRGIVTTWGKLVHGSVFYAVSSSLQCFTYCYFPPYLTYLN